jgi:two-component system chemotaxis response regulator CheY
VFDGSADVVERGADFAAGIGSFQSVQCARDRRVEFGAAGFVDRIPAGPGANQIGQDKAVIWWPKAERRLVGTGLWREGIEMNKKIVVVDDDLFDISMLRRGIKAAGVDVDIVTVSDSSNAIPVLRDENPDLAILDLKMPRPDGFDVLSALRSDKGMAGLKVLMLSGSTSAIDQERARTLGVNWYRVKPESLDGYRRLGAEISLLANN